MDRVVVAGAEFREQAGARGVAAADGGDAGALDLGQQLGDALAFLHRARQVAGRIDDQQHVELALAAALLAPLGDGHALDRIAAAEAFFRGRQPALQVERLPGPVRARAVVHDDERGVLDRGQRLGDLSRQQQFRQALAEVFQLHHGDAGREPRMLALERLDVELARTHERRGLGSRAEQRHAQLRGRFLHEQPGERSRGRLRHARRLACRLALRHQAHPARGGMHAQQVLGHAARRLEASRVARQDRDAPQAQLRREVVERRQYALELCARGILRIRAGGRAPEHHREIVDARERERARDVRGGQALHVGAVAAEIAEAREHNQARGELASSDRQHEHLTRGRADRAPAREVADRAIEDAVDRVGGAGGLHVREGAEHEGGRVALRDAALDERELDGADRCAALGAGRGGGRGMRHAHEFVQELALLALGEVVPVDLGGGRRAQIFLPQDWDRPASRQHVRQRAGRLATREVDDGAADVGVARQRAVAFLRVPGGHSWPVRKRERHGAVARGATAELELAPAATQVHDRVLAVARDQREALVGGGETGGLGFRGLQDFIGRPGALGPMRGVERIEVRAGGGGRQQAAEAGERREHLLREFLGIVREVEQREPAHQRVGAAQRLHRDECAAVGCAELDHAADSVRALVRESCARDQAAHAVADEDDVLAALALEVRGELAAVPGEAAAPVVGVVGGIEARDAQREPQALVGEAQRVQRQVAVAARQRELGELALRDLERVEPGDVRAAVLAQPADGRAHDAGQEQHARAAAHARRLPCQPRQFLVRFHVHDSKGDASHYRE